MEFDEWYLTNALGVLEIKAGESKIGFLSLNVGVKCYMLLCPCSYGLKQYGHLNNSCSFCLLFVLQFKIDNKKIIGNKKMLLLFLARVAE